MKLLEAIKKVKALLGAVKLTQTQLSDKSLIQFDGDEIEKSSVVYLIDAAGNLSVLPDGIYQTQDGLKFTVQFGTVTNVDDSKAAPAKEDTPVLQAQSKAKAPAAEPAPKAETPADTDDSEDDSEDDEDENPDADADAKQTQALIDAALAPIVAQIQAIQEAISQSTEMTKKTQTALSAISDAVAVISKEPAAKPIEKEVNPFKKVSEDEKETRLYKILHS